ncbi:MAG: transcriptional repressor [Thermomicrobia bacterium]|nr:transcriptional repressor [Thermomicrobia bacterium]
MSHETMDYEGIMHRAGHRVTPQRVMILDAVCAGHGHTTLKQIYGRLQRMDDTIDRSSVYRTLKLFVALRLVVSAETPAGETVYEIPKPKPHHHLICRICGSEQEIGQEAMAGMFALVEERYGFTVATDHLVLSGVCADCRKDSIAQGI